MKKISSILLTFILLISCLSINVSADSFEYPEIEYRFYNGFCYTRFFDEDGIKTKKGYVRILYYKGKKSKITVPKKIKGNKVFSIEGYGKIKTLHVPNNIKILNAGDADNLTKITVNKSNKKYSVKNNMLFNKNKTILYWCNKSIKTPKIPTSVKTIGKQAFYRSQIKTLNIPKNVVNINKRAFAFCENLEKINFNKKLINIRSEVFRDCNSLKTVKIPNSVKTLGRSAFSPCKNLESIELGNSVRILNSTFFGCKKLQSLIIPKSVIKIIDSPFGKCDSLKSVYIYNKDCKIEPLNDYDVFEVIPKSITIYGYKNSTAQEYAEKNGNEFVVLK